MRKMKSSSSHHGNSRTFFIWCLCVITHVTFTNAISGLHHGYDCDTVNRLCRSGFVCLNGKCACRYSNHQTYDQQALKCRSFIGGPCELDSYSNNLVSDLGREACVINAQCVERHDDNYKECQCLKGYVENADGYCDLEFGSKCIFSSQITTATTTAAKCDQIAGLFCRNGICDCKDELEIYDKESRKCKSGLGAFCKKNDDCFDDDFECTKISKHTGRGHCNCKKLFGFKGNCGSKAATQRPRYVETTTTTARSWNSRDLAPITTTTRYPWRRTTERPDIFYRILTTTKRSIYNVIPSEEEAEWINKPGRT